jgi:hypothetical protein
MQLKPLHTSNVEAVMVLLNRQRFRPFPDMVFRVIAYISIIMFELQQSYLTSIGSLIFMVCFWFLSTVSYEENID